MFSKRIEEYRLSDLIEPEFELLALTFQNKKLFFVQLADPQKLLISFVDGSSLGDPRGWNQELSVNGQILRVSGCGNAIDMR